MENYSQLKTRHQDEITNFEGMFFAFSDKQYIEGIKKLGLSKEQASTEIASFGGGGYIFKNRVNALDELTTSHKQQRESSFKDDNFLINALVYELINHEYCITYDEQDAIDALGLSAKDIPSHCLVLATKEALKKSDC